MTTGEGETKEQEKYNIFRDSVLRYLGYANEIGESFRYQYPKLVIPSYVVAFGYCFADAGTSGMDTWKETSSKWDAAAATADTLLWQTLASVTIPGLAINQIVRASRFAITRSPVVLSAMVAKWLPTTMGLCSIPLIVEPIDASVDYGMDSTIRQWDFKSKLLPDSENEPEKAS
jgi:mitochondrial fission process protein 1